MNQRWAFCQDVLGGSAAAAGANGAGLVRADGANGAGLVGADGAKGAGLVGSDMVGIPPLCVLRAFYTKFMPRGTPPKKTIAGLTMER
jgi:hypothetical protein